MSRRSRFEVEFDWEIDEGVEIKLVVSGFQQPVIPENRRGHPDTWTPAEGGELEDIEIRNERGALIPAIIAAALLDDEKFLRSVEEKLES